MFGFWGGGGLQRRWMRFMGNFGGGRFARKLDLTDEQIEKFCEIKDDSFAKFAHAKIDGMLLHQKLFKELSKETIDRQKVIEIGQKIKEHKALTTDLFVNNLLELTDILNPEQRKKLRNFQMKEFGPGTEECGPGRRRWQEEHCREEHGHHHHHEHECCHEDPSEHEPPGEFEEGGPPAPPPPPPRRGGPGFGRRH